MFCFYDDPNPPIKDSIRAAVFQQYLQQCVKQLDWNLIESAETELAIQALQEILLVMQNDKTDHKEALLEIDKIFMRKFGQSTAMGLRLRTETVLK